MTRRRNKIHHRAVLEAARFEPGSFGCSVCFTRFPYTTDAEKSGANRGLAWHLAGEHPDLSYTEIEP